MLFTHCLVLIAVWYSGMLVLTSYCVVLSFPLPLTFSDISGDFSDYQIGEKETPVVNSLTFDKSYM